MTTLKHEEAFLSIFGPRPFGISRLELGDGDRSAFIGVFTTHHIDAVHIYADAAERGPAYRKFLSNACTGRDFTYTMMEDGKEVTIRHVAMPVVIIGDIKITKAKAKASFQAYGYGYNYDTEIIEGVNIVEGKTFEIGNIEDFGTRNLFATMIVREVTREEQPISLHYELHVCLT